MKMICPSCKGEMETTTALVHYITNEGKVSINKTTKPVKGICANPKCNIKDVILKYDRKAKPGL